MILFQSTFMDVLNKSLYIVWIEGVIARNFVMKIFSQEILLVDCLHFRVLSKFIPLILALYQVNLHVLVRWNIPCKHFFTIFRLVDGWGWESLPDVYKRSPYLCDDSSALLGYLGSAVPDSGLSQAAPDSGPSEAALDISCMDEMMSTTELPVKNVRDVDTSVRHTS